MKKYLNSNILQSEIARHTLMVYSVFIVLIIIVAQVAIWASRNTLASTAFVESYSGLWCIGTEGQRIPSLESARVGECYVPTVNENRDNFMLIDPRSVGVAEVRVCPGNVYRADGSCPVEEEVTAVSSGRVVNCVGIAQSKCGEAKVEVFGGTADGGREVISSMVCKPAEVGRCNQDDNNPSVAMFRDDVRGNDGLLQPMSSGCRTGADCGGCEYPQVAFCSHSNQDSCKTNGGTCGCTGPAQSDPVCGGNVCRGQNSINTSCASSIPACPSGWTDCGTSNNRTNGSSRCERRDSCGTSCADCGNPVTIYRYCMPPDGPPPTDPPPQNRCETGAVDTPPNNTLVNAGDVVRFQGWASDADGIDRVEIRINDQLVTTLRSNTSNNDNFFAQVSCTNPDNPNDMTGIRCDVWRAGFRNAISWAYNYTATQTGNITMHARWYDRANLTSDQCQGGRTISVIQQRIIEFGGRLICADGTPITGGKVNVFSSNVSTINGTYDLDSMGRFSITNTGAEFVDLALGVQEYRLFGMNIRQGTQGTVARVRQDNEQNNCLTNPSVGPCHALSTGGQGNVCPADMTSYQQCRVNKSLDETGSRRFRFVVEGCSPDCTLLTQKVNGQVTDKINRGDRVTYELNTAGLRGNGTEARFYWRRSDRPGNVSGNWTEFTQVSIPVTDGRVSVTLNTNTLPADAPGFVITTNLYGGIGNMSLACTGNSNPGNSDNKRCSGVCERSFTFNPLTTTVPVTTPPRTTVPVTTPPRTTVPVTTPPRTTVPVTTPPRTTVPVTTPPRTTVPVTTTPPGSTVPVTTTPPGSTVPVTTVPVTITVTLTPTPPPGRLLEVRGNAYCLDDGANATRYAVPNTRVYVYDRDGRYYVVNTDEEGNFRQMINVSDIGNSEYVNEIGVLVLPFGNNSQTLPNGQIYGNMRPPAGTNDNFAENCALPELTQCEQIDRFGQNLPLCANNSMSGSTNYANCRVRTGEGITKQYNRFDFRFRNCEPTTVTPPVTTMPPGTTIPVTTIPVTTTPPAPGVCGGDCIDSRSCESGSRCIINAVPGRPGVCVGDGTTPRYDNCIMSDGRINPQCRDYCRLDRPTATPVPGGPNVRVEKRVIDNREATYREGDIVRFRVVITNTGGTVLTQVAFEDRYNQARLRFERVRNGRNGRTGDDITTLFRNNGGVISDTTGVISIANVLAIPVFGNINPGGTVEMIFEFTALRETSQTCNDVFVSIEKSREMTDRACVRIRSNRPVTDI
jgi:hypothetical protein